MGREGQKSNLPRGITVRENKTNSAIQIAFTYGGKQCRESLSLPPTKANIKFAEGLRAEIISKIERLTFDYADYFPESPKAKISEAGLTLGEMLDDYMLECERAVANEKMSPATLDGYKKIVDGAIKPSLGHIAVRAITPAQIQDWIKQQDLTAKSIRNYLTPLRSVLGDAQNLGIVEINPLLKLDLKRLIGRIGKKSKDMIDPFSKEEVRKILDACHGQTRNLFQFAFATGLRTSELIGLRWKDVDLKNKRIHVCQAVVVKTEKGTKTKAGNRYVELDQFAMEAIELQRQYSQLIGDRVFLDPRPRVEKPTPIAGDGVIRKSLWTPVLKKAGVKYRYPYQTRHTFASTHLSSGANPLWVANQMGHEDTEMITRRYGRWIQENHTRITRDVWATG